MKKLNLGCGERFNATWTNVDIVSHAPSVIQHDLRNPLPFPNRTFDLVYHSHVLEHLRRAEANRFIDECFRVLRRGGILRVVIPDLEQIVGQYVRNLERCREGNLQAIADYEWIMLELYDQTVRETSGGEMLGFLQNPSVTNREYVLQRVGNEAKKIFEAASHSQQAHPSNSGKTNFASRLKNSLAWFLGPRRFGNLRESIKSRLLTEREKLALEIGTFRLGGEVHQCMYDSFSLSQLLQNAGFQDVRVVDATQSGVANWRDEGLDADEFGNPFKPDSLFVEARKHNDGSA